jgi:hypothetical protein
MWVKAREREKNKEKHVNGAMFLTGNPLNLWSWDKVYSCITFTNQPACEHKRTRLCKPPTNRTQPVTARHRVSGPLCAQTPPAGKVLSKDDYESPEWAVLIKLRHNEGTRAV